jgi:hypothetical protein
VKGKVNYEAKRKTPACLFARGAEIFIRSFALSRATRGGSMRQARLESATVK